MSNTYKFTVGKIYMSRDGEGEVERHQLVLTPPIEINLLSQVDLYEELTAGDSLIFPEAKKAGILCIPDIFFRDEHKEVLVKKLKNLGYEAAQ